MKTDKRKKETTTSYKERKNKNVWELREACMKNAQNLWAESFLLFEHNHFSRAFSLSYTALEELGKFLIVSDFITGVSSKEEVVKAFRSHSIKMAYAHNKVLIDTSKDVFESPPPTVTYNEDEVKGFFELRNNSSYVGYTDNFKPIKPSESITKEMAAKIIDKVKTEIDFIYYAEELNGRIGSKALFK